MEAVRPSRNRADRHQMAQADQPTEDAKQRFAVGGARHNTSMAHRTWNDEQLVAAVAASTSYRGALRQLGLQQRSTASIRRHIDRLELSTTHFTQTRLYTDEALADAVAAAASVSEVLRLLGVKPAGGSHAHIGKRIRAAGLDTTHFGTDATRASSRRHTPQEILVRRPEGSHRARGETLRRALREIGRDYLCAECNRGPTWNGKPLTLHVEHIDGDAMNCLAENLCFLCPNCHTQTDTYARKKKSQPDVA